MLGLASPPPGYSPHFLASTLRCFAPSCWWSPCVFQKLPGPVRVGHTVWPRRLPWLHPRRPDSGVGAAGGVAPALSGSVHGGHRHLPRGGLRPCPVRWAVCTPPMQPQPRSTPTMRSWQTRVPRASSQPHTGGPAFKASVPQFPLLKWGHRLCRLGSPGPIQHRRVCSPHAWDLPLCRGSSLSPLSPHTHRV